MVVRKKKTRKRKKFSLMNWVLETYIDATPLIAIFVLIFAFELFSLIFTLDEPVISWVKFPFWYMLIITFVLMEIGFWTDPTKPSRGTSKFWYAVGVKVFYSFILLTILYPIYFLINAIIKYPLGFLKFLGVLGGVLVVIAGIIGIIYIYIKLNSLKYRK